MIEASWKIPATAVAAIEGEKIDHRGLVCMGTTLRERFVLAGYSEQRLPRIGRARRHLKVQMAYCAAA